VPRRAPTRRRGCWGSSGRRATRRHAGSSVGYRPRRAPAGGWLGDRGAHGPDRSAPRGEGGHQETVNRENLIRGEHGFKLRGTFKDPDCGESYWRVKAGPGRIVWSDYRKSCIAWRADYNKKNGTSYTIADTIP
jgi:hypothetical protein